MESLSHSIQTFVAAHGLEAVFLLMVLESACIPVPSEVTMIYAGYLVSQGDMSFIGAVLAGAFGNLVGSWIAWGAGFYGVDAWLYRTERNRRHVEQAHRWFERYGTPVVFFSRLVPVVRTFISLPAGIARMPFVRFSVLTILGCLPWCVLLVAIGDAAGANWDTWHRRLGDLNYVVVAAALVAGGVWLLRRRRAAAR
ncbi:MAG TPA: DedA family protein [Gaiellales bacterium]|nr:DedA family protein [Gaiellales bacterium]